ncbi:aldehyde dehydrogenase family protein [Kamptonema cortianum]|nr:aldehyde dehydrogenase family protein [Geitlerinema splendidum]MDK3161208.1 aldehyde dehydrogenase family protein [Kamptonema cortianum]
MPATMSFSQIVADLIPDLAQFSGKDLKVTTPIDGSEIASLKFDSPADIDKKIANSVKAFKAWRQVPAPRRGELIRLLGEKLRENKEALAQLVTLECGKIIEEGRGEVQEMIDICDFAVGLSRQLYGLTIASERPNHVMQENWHPLGPVGIISAFNFPVAVWSWNAALAIVCGDSCIWKPSEKTPLTALAVQNLFDQVCTDFPEAPEHLSQVILGDAAGGNQLVEDTRVPLISATGSTRMGRIVGPKVAARFGRSLLELGGNNAIIVTPSADLDVAMPSILFGSVGTAGQRCTSTRRVFVHESIFDQVFSSLKQAIQQIGDSKVGNPLESSTLVGPLIDQDAFACMQATLTKLKSSAFEIVGGERTLESEFPNAFYVRPALVSLKTQVECVHEETFAPLTYVMPYESLEEVMEVHNSVPQGLSSAIMTTDIREAEYFKQNSDCGIANVNIGTSGAEIGGAFGGEKETGGGRESGSDSWKAYMRRQTSTTYYGNYKPALAQGISFDV